MIPSRSELKEFCDSLEEERAYFKISFQRILNADLIIPEYHDGKLIALAAIEKKYGIVRSWTIVKKEYWRKGIGSRLMTKRLERLKKDRTCHVLLGIIEKKNIAAIKNVTKHGYKFVGRRGNLLYYSLPVSFWGYGKIFFMQGMFPLVGILDRLRK